MAAAMIPPPTAPRFLADHGWAGARIDPLAGDASFRRYFRVRDGERQAVLMDAPPEHEDSRPYLAVADHLREHGFRAPKALAIDLDQGLILLEDFGDRLMRSAIEAGADEASVYGQAIDLLAALHAQPVADVPAYDWDVYRREAALLIEWFAPAMGIGGDAADYEAAWREALAPLLRADARRVTVLRDYHAENLMLLDDGGMGLLDFQDALVGHPAYDLVSLLQDARRDVSPMLERAMIERYLAAAGVVDASAFEAAYALLGAQRNAKIIGIFTRLARRDGKARYLELIPRVWALLERDLAHPALARVKRWFDANIPPDCRRAPAA